MNQSAFAGLVILGCLLLLGGCASCPPKPQVPVDQVVAMSKEGMPTDALIEKMRDSGSVYPLPASKLIELKREGVSDEVLNYMEQTYLTEACRQAICDNRALVHGAHHRRLQLKRRWTSWQSMQIIFVASPAARLQ